MKNPIKEYIRLKKENRQLKYDVECLNSQITNMMEFSDSFRKFYDEIKKPVFYIGSKGVQTVAQTYTLHPHDNSSMEYIKNSMCQDLAKSIINYIDFDIKDDPYGRRVVLAKLSVLGKEVNV